MINKSIASIIGKGIPIPGDDIDTDRIIPARFLKEITFDNMGNYLFYDERIDTNGKETDHPLNAPKFKFGTVLIVGRNFGCGSSREHAPQAIKRYGIEAIIGESFAGIFANNCLSLGVPTVTLSREKLTELVQLINADPLLTFNIDIEEKTLFIHEIKWPLGISDSQQQALLDGSWNVIDSLKENTPLIHEVVKKLPYLH